MKETIADIKQKDGRMLHLHEDWKRWLAFNSNNLVWIALVSGGILFTTLLMKWRTIDRMVGETD